MRYSLTSCTPGEFAFMQKDHPRLVEKLGQNLVVIDDHHKDALPIVFVFMGTKRQRTFWLRDRDIDPKHVRLVTEHGRLQGLRARAIQVCLDPYWAPMGPDERYGTGQSEWYIRDLRSRYGDLWDVVHHLHPEDEKKWVRLA